MANSQEFRNSIELKLKIKGVREYCVGVTEGKKWMAKTDVQCYRTGSKLYVKSLPLI